MLKTSIDFFLMGGYALYVWPAYGITFFIIGLNIYYPWRAYKAFSKKIKSS